MSCNRREWLAAAAAAATTRLLPSTARLGRIGIQLYTVRRELARDPEGTLARLAQIGYREVEFVDYPSGSPAEVRALLGRLGLTAPSSHVSLQAIRSNTDAVFEPAAAIGQRFVVVAFIPAGERKSLDDWKRIAGTLNQAGEAARRHGLQFCYHNHDFEFSAVDGTVPYDLLLSSTDPHLVQLELDLFWIARGGRDPLAYFARWPGRFSLVHVKDMDATPRRFFTEVGKGTIDFRRTLRRAGQAGIRHYFYEQDETAGDVFASARTSYDYLRALRF